MRGIGGCDTCQVSKHSHSAVGGPAERRTTQRLELAHADLLGPMEQPSHGGNLYALMFTDDKTRMRFIYFLKLKSEAAGKLCVFIRDVAKAHGVRLQQLRTDRGGEFSQGEFEAACKAASVRQ